MKLCKWESEWFGRRDVAMCPAAATVGDYCAAHASALFEAAEVAPAETAAAVATRIRIARLYKHAEAGR
jgi:hypothetical protein